MGAGAAVRRGRHGSLRVAPLIATALLLASAGASPWRWGDVAGAEPQPAAAALVPWHDALDASLGARVGTDGALSADVSLRWRLDAAAYLAAARADAADLAEHIATLERQAWLQEQLEVVARACAGAWRALQAALIEGFAADALAHGYPPESLRELDLLRTLLGLDAPTPAGVAPLSDCRLDDLVVGLEVDPRHPRIVEAAAAARLDERATHAIGTPAPASLWLHADAARDRFGSRLGVRVGIDVPLQVAVGGAALTLGSDGRVADATLRWVHGGGSAHRHTARPATAALDPWAELAVATTRRRVEAALHRVEADRRWAYACGGAALAVVIVCVERPVVGLDQLDTLLAAIDAELSVLHAVLAAVEASGRALVELLPSPP